MGMIHGCPLYNNWINGQGGTSDIVDMKEKAIGVLVDIGGVAKIINNNIDSGGDSRRNNTNSSVALVFT